MAEPISSTILHSSKLKTPLPKAQRSATSSFSPSVLLKLVFFVVFVALLPLFPSQAPDFVGESVFTRVCWELVHLLFVGIAVSYGLFSRRNADADLDKEPPPPPKDDSPRSFVSQMLHVPSVFDHDDDEAGGPLGSVDANKIQTWSSQYYRNEPPVVVSDGGNAAANQATAKHLSLPVRSLKPRDEESGSSKQVDGRFRSANISRGISDSGNGSKESVVLPSPIPWTSRSGRMETKVEQAVGNPGAAPPLSSPPRPPALAVDKVFSKTTSFRLPAAAASESASSTMPLPRRLSPPRSLSPGKTKTKSTYKSTPPPTPPPPPPPPPPAVYSGHGCGYQPTIEKRVTARSFKDELVDLSRRGREDRRSANDVDPWAPKPRSSVEGSSIGRSVRTVRAKEVQSAAKDEAPRTRNVQSQPRQFEAPKPPPVPKYAADDSESDDDGDEVAEPSAKEEASSSAAAPAGADENEVDKKADEFIARFREQIRLQRIESIKRSTKQRSNRKPQQ